MAFLPISGKSEGPLVAIFAERERERERERGKWILGLKRVLYTELRVYNKPLILISAFRV